ncbi:MAG TPA: S41 family peptidase [Gammaproteobacteria bacterium]
MISEKTKTRDRFASERAILPLLTSHFSRILFVTVVVSCPAHAGSVEEEALPWQDAHRFVEALETIRTQYAEPVDDETLINEAIRGMAAGLDRYSVYLAPAEYEQARIDALGRYEGIGVEVSRAAQGGYVVVAPFDGGPAARAGIQSGDLLLRANGVSLERADPAELDRILHGDPGSAVTLSVQRGEQPPFDVTLVREIIRIPSISGKTLPSGVRYARIAMFSDRSARDLAELLDDLDIKDDDVPGLIIDLRDNAGGVVEGAVDIADLFLDEGVIVSTSGRAPGQTFDYLAKPGGIAAGIPIVLLVNGGTASAAEIVAGALQDYDRATLFGTRTFGKGAVQTLIPLAGGGALKLTTAHYRTPSGSRIDSAGIVPDIEVAMADDAPKAAPTEDDALVQRAVEFLASPVAMKEGMQP